MQCVKADLRRHFYLEVSKTAAPSFLALLKRVVSPRFTPVLLCRLAHYSYRMKLKPFAKLFSLMNFFLFGIEITHRCEIGPGLYFPHTVGTVVGAAAIGANAVIYQGVTLGAKELDLAFDPALRPTIGDDVVVGSGAKVLGSVTIGNGAVIAANAVVLRDVPEETVVGGIPARELRRKESGE